MKSLPQIDFSVQILWKQIGGNSENSHNGAVIALLTLLGALSAICVGCISGAFFERWGVWLIAACSAAQCGLILAMGMFDNAIVSYVAYIMFGVIYYFMITVAR